MVIHYLSRKVRFRRVALAVDAVLPATFFFLQVDYSAETAIFCELAIKKESVRINK